MEAVNPANVQALSISAFICVRKEAYEKAISNYKRIIYSQPHNAQAYLFLGIVYRKAGKKEEAILAWRKAMDEDDEGEIAGLAQNELQRLKGVR